QNAERRQPTVGDDLAAELAGLAITQQQSHGPSGQCTPACTGQQISQATFTTARQEVAQATTRPTHVIRALFLLQKVLTGLQKLIEQTAGFHGDSRKRNERINRARRRPAE